MSFTFHAVNKVRENMKKEDKPGLGASNSPPKQNSGWQKPTELQSYSSKMMKSIWGEYNRYSVHNFKSNQSSQGAASVGGGLGRPRSPERARSSGGPAPPAAGFFGSHQ